MSAANRQFGQDQTLNGGIDLGTSDQTSLNPASTLAYTGNLGGQWRKPTPAAVANTEFAVAHDLGRVPSFYWYIANAAVIVYGTPTSGTPWTKTQIFVKMNGAGAGVELRMYLI